MKKTILYFILFITISLHAQFNPDLVHQLYSGTQADMLSIDIPVSEGDLFYNTTDDMIYYHIGSEWISIGIDNQNIEGSGLSGDILTIDIEGGTGETVNLSALRDNLGNHIATTNIETTANYLSGDGDSEGLFVANNGNVGINTNSPSVALEVSGKTQNQNVRATVSANSAETMNSINYIDLPGLSLTVNTAVSELLIVANIPGLRNEGDMSINLRIVVDGVQVGAIIEEEDDHNNGIIWSSTLHALTSVTAGNHVIKVQWSSQAGATAHLNDGQNIIDGDRTLSVIEL